MVPVRGVRSILANKGWEDIVGKHCELQTLSIIGRKRQNQWRTYLNLNSTLVNQNRQLTRFHHHLRNNAILNWTVFRKLFHFLIAVGNITSFCQSSSSLMVIEVISLSNLVIIDENWRKFTVKFIRVVLNFYCPFLYKWVWCSLGPDYIWQAWSSPPVTRGLRVELLQEEINICEQVHIRWRPKPSSNWLPSLQESCSMMELW